MVSKIGLSVLFIAALMYPLSAVEYENEKSSLIEAKYDICIIPPQINDAISKGVNVVDVATAKELFDKNAYFYDAREKRHYQQQHVKGAFPVYFDISKAEYVVIQLPRDKEESLVFYCYGESCANSYEAALAVRKLGYKHVYWLLNGFPEWKANGFPVQ